LHGTRAIGIAVKPLRQFPNRPEDSVQRLFCFCTESGRFGRWYANAGRLGLWESPETAARPADQNDSWTIRVTAVGLSG
jgi:hypothetical protein